jgi:hypothetical protein
MDSIAKYELNDWISTPDVKYTIKYKCKLKIYIYILL